MTRRSQRQDELVRSFNVDDPPHRIGVAFREVRRGALAYSPSSIGLPTSLVEGQQMDALGVLVIDYPDGCRMSELADALRIVASTATRVVDSLVAGGLAARYPSDQDGRAMIVEPTKRGIDLYLRTMKLTSPLMRQRLDQALSRGEQAVLADLLERLIAVYDEANGRIARSTQS